MKKLLASFLSVALGVLLPCSAFAGNDGYKVTYDGGSVSNVKTGAGLKLRMEGKQIEFFKGNDQVLAVPSSSVTEISYGQDVHRRVGAAIGLAVISFGIGALMALTKSKKHYVGLTWADGDAKGGLAIQCDKNDYRGILTGLEGVTGKTAVDSEAMNVKN
jgi:CxxC motif-containing protein (DUF1111 family)